MRSAEITERQGIPRRYLEPVLQELVRHGILLGIRGPSGGYRLARERRLVSLGDIVRTVRGLETAEDPISDPAGSALGHQVVRPLWLELQEEMMRRLDAHYPRRSVHPRPSRRDRRANRRIRRFRDLSRQLLVAVPAADLHKLRTPGRYV